MERLTKLKNLNSKRIAFIYGRNTLDRFMTNDYREIDFEEALCEILHSQGFQRIVFFGYDRRIYFKDEQSRILTAPLRKQQSSGSSRSFLGLVGPLGTQRVERTEPSSDQNRNLKLAIHE